jgi:CIC family chloride channel protein
VGEPSFDEPDATPPRRAWLLMVALGGLIGLLVGCLASAFRLVVDALVKEREGLFEALVSVPVLGWLGPILLVGISLLAAAELVRRFAPEAGGSGIQEVEGALEDEHRLRWQRVLPVKFVGAVMALGSGAVLGREGPTVHMGGALGAMLSDRFRLTTRNRHILIAAGAAAGLSAAFNAPLAGVFFVFEEMRRRFRFHFTSIEAVLVAAAVADLVVRLVTGQGPVIQMLVYPESPLGALWLFPLFGALFGGFGVAFNGLLLGTLNRIDLLPGVAHRLAPFAIGAGLGALGYWLPDAVGGGYGAIGDALTGRIAGGFLLLLFTIRFVATLFSYGSGAPGGIFAPMLALGTLFGMWFGTSIHELAPHMVPHAGVFAVAGMAAFFAATVRAPLTGIALAVEMTGNFDQVLPLILTCVAAGLAAQALGGRPIYELLLERAQRRAPRREN